MDIMELAALGRKMMDEHGLQSWKFGFIGSNHSYGSTQFRPAKDSPDDKLQFDIGICISHTLAAVNTVELTKDVLLHEIAHARLVQEYIQRMPTRAHFERLHCEMSSVSGHSDIWRMEYLKIGGCGMECWEDWKGKKVILPPTLADQTGLFVTQFIGESPVITLKNGVTLLE